ncbi:DUF5347 domain-containing protein [Dickeya oryzae]|uniref:DUF5347 domain-containing protein n=1 Tax=Dickeya oryzae TaxID=1240404 RepID=UPI001FEF9848|nr:DUF5347 domain-containing protein [Dickeya oryzae]
MFGGFMSATANRIYDVTITPDNVAAYQAGIRHLSGIRRKLLNVDPDEQLEMHLERLGEGAGKTKGVIYFCAGITRTRHGIKFRELSADEQSAVRKAMLALFVDINSIPKNLI